MSEFIHYKESPTRANRRLRCVIKDSAENQTEEEYEFVFNIGVAQQNRV